MRTITDKYPKALTFRPATLLIANCKLDDAAAQSVLANVQAMMGVRHREEEDQSNRQAYKFAALRLKQEKQHVERLRDGLQKVRTPAAGTLTMACTAMLDELDKAIKRAPKLGQVEAAISTDQSVPMPDWLVDAEKAETDIVAVDLGDID